MIHNDIKKAEENGDISSLKYFFCDCLDGDPTFSEYKDDYEYCKSRGILFVPHSELHPMLCSSVNEEYWIQLKKDFMQNPSIERMEHMREVAKILYSDRIRKIEEDNARKSALKTVSETIQPEPVQPPVSTAKPVSKPAVQPNVQAGSPVRMSSEPVRPVNDGVRRVSEPVRPANDGVRRVSEPVRPANDGVRRVSEPVRPANDGVRRVSEPIRTVTESHGTQPKKADGVNRKTVAVLAVVIIIVLIRLINK